MTHFSTPAMLAAMKDKSWRDNLRAAIKAKRSNMKAVSIDAGLGETFVRDVLERGFDPKVSNFVALAEALEMEPSDLLERHGAPKRDGDMIRIPTYDIEASAGHGSLVNDGEPLFYQPFRESFLRKRTRSALDALSVIQVRGDSMWETLHDGDQVLIDRQQQNLARAGLYVLSIQGELVIKRVTMNPVTKLVTVKSDNPAYEAYRDLDPSDLVVVGRVIWIGREI